MLPHDHPRSAGYRARRLPPTLGATTTPSGTIVEGPQRLASLTRTPAAQLAIRGCVRHRRSRSLDLGALIRGAPGRVADRAGIRQLLGSDADLRRPLSASRLLANLVEQRRHGLRHARPALLPEDLLLRVRPPPCDLRQLEAGDDARCRSLLGRWCVRDAPSADHPDQRSRVADRGSGRVSLHQLRLHRLAGARRHRGVHRARCSCLGFCTGA